MQPGPRGKGEISRLESSGNGGTARYFIDGKNTPSGATIQVVFWSFPKKGASFLSDRANMGWLGAETAWDAPKRVPIVTICSASSSANSSGGNFAGGILFVNDIYD
jgi:hypothetical protein